MSHGMIGADIREAVKAEIQDFAESQLHGILGQLGNYAIKFIASHLAEKYTVKKPIKISKNPALTWGTATYVTPLAFPLSSALYGRTGIVATFDPTGWKVFDATRESARVAYIRWAAAQPFYRTLMLTVHSTDANHRLRNEFRRAFEIDCVLFHPDQVAEGHTDENEHVWMAVTDWTDRKTIDDDMSRRFADARFTVLVDEDFATQIDGLPIQRARQHIEPITAMIGNQESLDIVSARTDPLLPALVRDSYDNDGYLHVYIQP